MNRDTQRMARPISGGSGLTEEDKAGVVTAVKEVLKPHADQLAASQAQIAAVQAEVVALKAENEGLKKLVRVEREGDQDLFLANGQKFPLGKGITTMPFRAGSLGGDSRPILLTDYARMVSAGARGMDTSKYTRLQDLSQKLQRFGHKQSPDMASTILPITTNPDYFYAEQFGEECEAVVREIKAAAWVDPDPAGTQDQIRWFVSKMMGTKQQASDNDLLGGSLAGMPQTGDIIPLLQATAILGRAGARSVPLPPEGMRWPRETSAPVFAYVNENGTIPFTTITTGVMNMSVKKAGAIIKIPRELLLLVNAAESFFRSALVRGGALTEDLAGLEGAGGSTTPKGIIRWDRSADDVPDASKVTLHNAQTVAANGDTFGPNDPADMVTMLEEANYPDGPTAFIMRPKHWGYIKNIRAGGSTTTDGPFLFNYDRGIGQSLPKGLEGVPVLTSTQVNKTSIKGSGTTLTYVLAGDFRQVYLGRVGTIELATDMSLGFAEEQVWVRAIYRHDVSLAQPSAMVICPTLLNG